MGIRTEMKDFLIDYKFKLLGKNYAISGIEDGEDISKLDTAIAIGMLRDLNYKPGVRVGIEFVILDKITGKFVKLNSADFEFGVNVASVDEHTGVMKDILHIDGEIEWVSQDIILRQREHALHGLSTLGYVSTVTELMQFKGLLRVHTGSHWVQVVVEKKDGEICEYAVNHPLYEITESGGVVTYIIKGYSPVGDLVEHKFEVAHDKSIAVISLTDGSCAGYNAETEEFWEIGMSNEKA